MVAEKMFSSPERLKVVELLLFRPETVLKVREIAKKVRVSPALVSGTITLLKKAKIIRGSKVDYFHPVAKSLKIMLNIEKLESIKLIQKARSLFKDCTGIGLYGSWANGTNTKDSDLDLWIKSDKESAEKVSELRRIFKRLGIEANIIMLTEKRMEKLKENDFVFYCMLYNSFILWGEGL